MVHVFGIHSMVIPLPSTLCQALQHTEQYHRGIPLETHNQGRKGFNQIQLGKELAHDPVALFVSVSTLLSIVPAIIFVIS